MRMVTRLLLLPIALLAGACGGGDGPAGEPASPDADADGDSGAPGTGCEGASPLEVPLDPTEPGPWPVGVRTVTADSLTAEVWYPAESGSEDGATPVTYDLAEHLPAADRSKVEGATIACPCFRDLPPDGDHGPYPVVIFLHGTAGFRTASSRLLAHWASRGFVVVAADHPHLDLASVLASDLSGANPSGDALALRQALLEAGGELGFLAGSLDTSRMAVAGHSAGGLSLGSLGVFAGVRVLIALAAGGTEEGQYLSSTLVMGAQDDAIVPYVQQQAGYEDSPAPKRLVGLERGAHLAFTDLCTVGPPGGGFYKLLGDSGVELTPVLSSLAQSGCQGELGADDALAVVRHATTAVLEETLRCSAAAAGEIEGMEARLAGVLEVREELE